MKLNSQKKNVLEYSKNEKSFTLPSLINVKLSDQYCKSKPSRSYFTKRYQYLLMQSKKRFF